MGIENDGLPVRFELKWLAGPFLIILVAAGVALFFPAIEPPLPPSPGPEQPILVTPTIDVSAAKQLAHSQCEFTFDCAEKDCLEKALIHIDSATHTIDAVLRTPSPRALRDHLRTAIERGVVVRLVLDSSLNPKFYLKGANIRIKKISSFVATNFMIIDTTSVVIGSNPTIFAAPPDSIRVSCNEKEFSPYLTLFDRVWKNESSPHTPEGMAEEVLSDTQLVINSPSTCTESSCGPDTFYCEGTTKVWQHYSCSSACGYTIIPLYYSPDCGYSNPGFGPDGNPLVVISETEVDEGQIKSEFIEFTSIQSLELSSFSLLKNGQSLVTFPSPFILDGSAKVFTGTGIDSPTSIYLDLSSPLWKQPGTVATLVNPNGEVVAIQTFEGG